MVSSQILLGMGCSIVSTILTNIGILIQKHSADVEKGKHLCKRWRFWLGFTINMGSEVGLTTVALALAPLSFIAPLAGLAVVFNALIAHLGVIPGVKERMRRTEWLATVCIMAGVTLVAISGPGGGGDSDESAPVNPPVSELPLAFSRPGFLVYAGCAASLVLAWLIVSEQRCFPTLRRRYRPSEDSTTASVCSSFTAALTSGFSIVFLKVIALAVAELSSQGIGPTPLVAICGVGLAISAPLQLYLLNMTLASGRATFTIPLYLSLTMVLTSASGGILFNEFAPIAQREPAPVWIIVYSLGVVIVMVGLVVLSSRQEAKAMRRELHSKTSVDLGSQATEKALASDRSSLVGDEPPDATIAAGGDSDSVCITVCDVAEESSPADATSKSRKPRKNGHKRVTESWRAIDSLPEPGGAERAWTQKEGPPRSAHAFASSEELSGASSASGEAPQPSCGDGSLPMTPAAAAARRSSNRAALGAPPPRDARVYSEPRAAAAAAERRRTLLPTDDRRSQRSARNSTDVKEPSMSLRIARNGSVKLGDALRSPREPRVEPRYKQKPRPSRSKQGSTPASRSHQRLEAIGAMDRRISHGTAPAVSSARTGGTPTPTSGASGNTVVGAFDSSEDQEWGECEA